MRIAIGSLCYETNSFGNTMVTAKMLRASTVEATELKKATVAAIPIWVAFSI